MNPDEIQAGFIRQRRGLFLISLVFTVALVFGINGTAVRLGPASGTGISVDLQNVKIIYGGLCAIWLWFSYRYWVYFSKVRGPAKTEMTAVIEGLARTRFKSAWEKLADIEVREKIIENYPNMKSFKFDKFRYHDPVLSREHRYMKWSLEWKATIAKTDAPSVSTGDAAEEDIKVEGWRYDLKLWGILLTTYWRNPYFSEYYAAWFVAAVPALIALLYPDHLQTVLNATE